MQDAPSRYSAAYRRATLEQRLGMLTEKTAGCWYWLGKLDAYGYGKIYVGAKTRMAHQIAHQLHVGPVPKGLVINHKCHTWDTACKGGNTCKHRSCVNPAHLEATTNRANILEGRGRGAIEARMTHCPKGHPLSGENLYIAPGGTRRRCRICNINGARVQRGKPPLEEQEA